MHAAGAAGARSLAGGLIRDERGTVTAEFAVVMPAVLVVLGLVIGGVFIAAHRITLVSLAAEVARLEARGDTDRARARLDEAQGAITVQRDRSGSLLCVTLRASPGRGMLSAIAIESRSCAAVSSEQGASP